LHASSAPRTLRTLLHASVGCSRSLSTGRFGCTQTVVRGYTTGAERGHGRPGYE